MNLEDALKRIAILEQENKALQVENEEQRLLIFKQQQKLNELLKDKEIVREKLIIERTKPFVAKSEKINEIVINEPEAVLKENEQTKAQVGRKKGGKNFANVDLEAAVVDTVYEDPDSLVCPTCSNDLTLASQKERYIIEVIPSTIKVTKVIKRSYKCKHDQTFVYPLSQEVFPGSVLTPAFATYIAYHKYELGIPFHHLEKHLTNVLNVPISKQLLATWMQTLATKLTPVYNAMKRDLLNNSVKVIHADETTLSIAKRPENAVNRKKSYVYVYASSYFDQQIHLYDFHESRTINLTAKWLEKYDGYIVCDDYAGYTKLTKNNPAIKLQRCWAHARRRFSDILKALPVSEVKATLSYKILTLINELFAYEAKYKTDAVLPSEICEKRHHDQIPLLNELKTYIFDTPLSPNSALEGAIHYVRKIWDELLTYLDYPYLEISNNLAERAVKPFVINRKVFMTAGSYAGAKYTTVIFSVIRTALINNLNIEKYLIYLLENLDKQPLDELLPYAPKLPNKLKV